MVRQERRFGQSIWSNLWGSKWQGNSWNNQSIWWNNNIGASRRGGYCKGKIYYYVGLRSLQIFTCKCQVGTALVDIEVKVQGTSPTSKLSNKPEEILPRVEKSRASSDSFSRDAAIPSSFDQKVMTTPAVRKLAKENGIDLSSLQGSGPKGRILKEDVLGLAISNSSVGSGTASKQRPPLATSSGSYRPAGNVSTSSTPPQPSSHSTTNTGTPSSSSTVDQRVPIRGIQRLMVKSMNAALQVPHNYSYHLTLCIAFGFTLST